MRLNRLLLPLVIAASVLPVWSATQNEAGLEYFEKHVRPLLAARCQACHSTQLKSGNIDLSSVEGFVNARDEAALVSVDDPTTSRLLAIVGYEGRVKMPPSGKLSDAELAILRRWVQQGAPWPGAEQREAMIPEGQSDGFTVEQRNYWAFQPIADPELPEVSDAAWTSNPVDRFVYAKLAAEGLEPVEPADKLTLLRRATFDLTGLPPTPEEAAAFLADDSPGAFEAVIERLLASPVYGERWGRHWLDVVRYADSTGNDEDHRYPHAWKYRDYVIDAFNDDMPYNQFVREQVAGDLVPSPDGAEINVRGTIATGFLALGPKAIAQQDKTRMLYDVYDEQIDVMSKALLGLTVACARCHDHKFDPILTKDYYSLAGIFASTRNYRSPRTHVSTMLLKPLVANEVYERYRAEQDLIKNKQIELDNLADEEIEHYIDSIADRVSDYMLAAVSIYEGGADAADLAAEQGLDERELARWADYLKPTEIPRAQLAEWREAMPSQREEVAADYERRFGETLKEWHHTIRRWRAAAIETIREAAMPPPPKPRFLPGRDRFFYDIYHAKKGPLQFSGDRQNQVLKPETVAKIEGLKAELKELKEDGMPEPPMANAVEDGESVEQRVFVRGDYNSEGEPAPKVFPAIIAGADQQPVQEGSGRLELANWLVSPDNPLTARVMVNRIWQKHFGEGIVGSPSNFGKLGERPTHPELLDWLAKRFVDDGWSVKQMHRRLMLSRTYQLDSRPTAGLVAADPSNLWLGRFNRRRLDVEELRDGMLAIDRSLDLAMGGTMQSGTGTDRENSNARLSIDPTTSTRRMVYLPLRRANLPTLLNLFDFGDAVTSIGKRAVTNVAPQALFMMNSEFVTSRAENLANQLLDEDRWSDAERVRHAYMRVLTREPDSAEIDNALSYLGTFSTRFEDDSSERAWQSYCRILLASNDFIFVD